MTLEFLKSKKIPDSPGVYLFKKGKEILYIGKATSLKDRTKSYFAKDLIKNRGPLILDMVNLATNVTYKKTNSVLEALMLETSLIKKYQPKYNIKEKDNRSSNVVIITDEDFPRVLIIRDRELKQNKNLKKLKIKNEYGPFPNGNQLKEALKIIRKMFPFLDEKSLSKNSRLNIQMNLEPDLKKISKKAYAKNIKNIKLFFEGKTASILKRLEKEMMQKAKDKEFEEAAKIKRKIFSLKHIDDVNLIYKETDDQYKFEQNLIKIESYDVAHFAGSSPVGALVVMENGQLIKNQYRKFILRESSPGDDYGGLKEILNRRLKHDEWILPKIIVIDGGLAQKNTAEKVLSEFGFQIPVVAVVKDEHHKPKNIIGDKRIINKYSRDILKINHETHRFAISFHRKRQRKVLK